MCVFCLFLYLWGILKKKILNKYRIKCKCFIFYLIPLQRILAFKEIFFLKMTKLQKKKVILRVYKLDKVMLFYGIASKENWLVRSDFKVIINSDLRETFFLNKHLYNRCCFFVSK